MNILKLTSDKLAINNETSKLFGDSSTSLYIETAAENSDDKTTVYEYKADVRMTHKFFENLCDGIRRELQTVGDIVIHQRLGKIPATEFSFLLVISSPCRKEVVKATERCIAGFKNSAPISKEAVQVKNRSIKSFLYPETVNLYKPLDEEPVQMDDFLPYYQQARVNKKILEDRITNMSENKRQKLNIMNIRQFCHRDNEQVDSCARIDAVFHRSEGSKSHLEVRRHLNNYQYRDCSNISEELRKYTPENGIDERLENLESQLCLASPYSTNIFERLKALEDRLLHLESISPEYIQYWARIGFPVRRKRKIYTVPEIDAMIADLKSKQAAKRQKT